MKTFHIPQKFSSARSVQPNSMFVYPLEFHPTNTATNNHGKFRQVRVLSNVHLWTPSQPFQQHYGVSSLAPDPWEWCSSCIMKFLLGKSSNPRYPLPSSMHPKGKVSPCSRKPSINSNTFPSNIENAIKTKQQYGWCHKVPRYTKAKYMKRIPPKEFWSPTILPIVKRYGSKRRWTIPWGILMYCWSPWCLQTKVLKRVKRITRQTLVAAGYAVAVAHVLITSCQKSSLWMIFKITFDSQHPNIVFASTLQADSVSRHPGNVFRYDSEHLCQEARSCFELLGRECQEQEVRQVTVVFAVQSLGKWAPQILTTILLRVITGTQSFRLVGIKTQSCKQTDYFQRLLFQSPPTVPV